MKSKVLDLDVNDPNHQENGLDIFALDNVLYYGISRTIRERIWYYAEKASGIVLSALIYSAVTGLIFAGFCMLTGRYAVSGYTPEVYEACLAANREQTSGPAAGIPANTGQAEKLSGKELLRLQWQQLSPEGKTLTFLRIAAGLVMLILLAAGFLSGNAALAFYITGRWQRGINPFSITAIVVIICLGRLLLFVMDLIFTLISTEIPEKARTIFQLIRSLLRSVILIGLFYNCLSYLGVNTGALLASVGVFSLALSLGAKDLVADILAGLGIVMEEQFQTGDVVEIGGFKGFVEEIGIRTTKIRTLGTNNIKIINNSQINNVINYSRELSLFRVHIDLPVFLPIDMVTEYLERELPGIREEIPTIISGPEFAGITAIDREHMTIMIAGQCQEKDEGLINRAMNLKIKERIDRLIDIQYK